MKTETCQFTGSDGCSPSFDNALDGPNTLVLAFGDAALLDDGSAIDDLTQAFQVRF